MRRKPARTLPVIIGLAALGLGAASVNLALQARSAIPSALPRAKRLMDLPSSHPFYWWINADEALLFRDPARRDFTFLRRRVATAAESELTALTALFRATRGKPETIRIAPDGTRLLWEGAGNQTVLATLDGTQKAQVARRGPGVSLWNSDSARWFELLEQNGKYAFGLTHAFPVDPQRSPLSLPIAHAFPADPRQADLEHLAVTTSDHLLVHLRDPEAPIERAAVIATGFGANPMAARTLSLPAPFPNRGGTLSFEPKTMRVAWTLRFDQPLQQTLYEWSLARRDPSKDRAGFWVSDQNSRKTVALGCLETRPDDPASTPLNVQLLPGGKTLSFVYRNALWMLPVEAGP